MAAAAAVVEGGAQEALTAATRSGQRAGLAASLQLSSRAAPLLKALLALLLALLQQAQQGGPAAAKLAALQACPLDGMQGALQCPAQWALQATALMRRGRAAPPAMQLLPLGMMEGMSSSMGTFESQAGQPLASCLHALSSFLPPCQSSLSLSLVSIFSASSL